MPPEIRRFFVILTGAALFAMLVWAARFEPLPPADFSFQSGTDPQTLDPHRATGRPENLILQNLFRGLLQPLPVGAPDSETGLQPLLPQPAIAESYETSADGKMYTFQLRRDATWSDGVPITAHDVLWSWTRMLHPATACQYTFQLFSLPYAKQFSLSEVNVGDRVEVELWDRPGESEGREPNVQHFPRGTVLHGTLREVLQTPRPTPADGQSEQTNDAVIAKWEDDRVFVVDIATVDENGDVDWDGATETASFSVNAATSPTRRDDTRQTHGVLVAFDKLGGVKVVDDYTLVVKLNDPLPYFTQLLTHPSTYIVPRHVIEKFGQPLWTKAENMVCSGPFKIGKRLLRDRVRMVKNDRYFDADEVSIETIDAFSTDSSNTALNMYETGQLHWLFDPPSLLLKELQERDDYISAPKLSIYFFRVNVTRPPMDDARVRRALAMAIDRQQIVDQITKAGQLPAKRLVPPGIAGYESPSGFKADLNEAKRLLTEAGYPGGRGFPKVTLLYNTRETHRAIAEVLQQQWSNTLSVKVDLQNMEWGSYLDKVDQLDYDIARGGWIADYEDPTTFLSLWVTDGDQNSTGWGDAAYDELIRRAAAEPDSATRMTLLAEAEKIWIDQLPAIPLYFYVSNNLVKPNVEGFFSTAQDRHPLHLLRLRPSGQDGESR